MQFRSADDEQLVFFVYDWGLVSGTSHRRQSYQRLCTTPCEARLTAGRRLLAFEPADGGRRHVLDYEVDVQDGAVLTAQYGSTIPEFVGAWALTVLAPVVGGVIAAVSVANSESTACLNDCPGHWRTAAVASGVLGAAGLAIGVWLVLGLEHTSLDVSLGPTSH